jgi:hypothetical protein
MFDGIGSSYHENREVPPLTCIVIELLMMRVHVP